MPILNRSLESTGGAPTAGTAWLLRNPQWDNEISEHDIERQLAISPMEVCVLFSKSIPVQPQAQC